MGNSMSFVHRKLQLCRPVEIFLLFCNSVFQMGDWIHCNNCFLRPGTAPVQFRLTTCGHIYCDACVENGRLYAISLNML